MDIVETLTMEKAQQYQNEIFAQIIANTTQPVINGEIVPLNADGTPNYTAQRTKAWDVPQVSPDDTYYIQNHSGATLTGSSEWDYARRPCPPEWEDAEMMEDMEFNTQYNQPEFK